MEYITSNLKYLTTQLPKLFLVVALIPFNVSIYAQSKTKVNHSYNEELPRILEGTSGFRENKGQIVDQFGQPRDDIKFSFDNKNNFKLHLKENGFSYEVYELIPAQPIVDESTGKVINYRKKDYSWNRVDIELEGVNEEATFEKRQPGKYYSNYFIGNKRIEQVYDYSQVVYRDIYPNIDLAFKWVDQLEKLDDDFLKIKYEFIVHPGGNPNDIRLKYNGSNRMMIDDNGSFNIYIDKGIIYETPPVCFTKSKSVKSNFKLKKNRLSFEIGKYSPSETLIIDPSLFLTLKIGTYYGGGDIDKAYAVDVGQNNMIYATGETNSQGIASTGVYQGSHSDGQYPDVFVAKFEDNLDNLLWATYYGGTSQQPDMGIDIKVDDDGSIYVVGFLASENIAFGNNIHQQLYGGGGSDAFLARFTENGNLTWSTYLGGNQKDEALGLTISGNNIGIVGFTESNNNIATMPPPYSGRQDGFIASFNKNNGVRLWGRYINGVEDDRVNDVTSDDAGNFYLVGTTESDAGFTFGNTNPASNFIDDQECFIMKINGNGTPVWGTYFGGGRNDQGMGIDFQNGKLAIVGTTESNDLPAAINTSINRNDIFITQYDANGNLDWNRYYGGIGEDYARDIAFNSLGEIIIVGNTLSGEGISNEGSFQNGFGGGSQHGDGFLAKFSPNGNPYWSSYFGDANEDIAYSVAVNNFDEIVLAGETGSTQNIATQGGYSTVNNGGSSDAFIVKFCDLVIKEQPKSQIIWLGNQIQLSVTVVGSQPSQISYQWQKLEGSIWQNIPGATDRTYTIDNAQIEDTGSYRCLIISECFKLSAFNGIIPEPASNIAEIQVQGILGPNAICLGDTATISTSDLTGATGITELTYSWSSTSPGAGLPANLSNHEITVQPTTIGIKTYQVTVQYKLNGETVVPQISNIDIAVNDIPEILSSQSNYTICSGESFKIPITSTVQNTTFSWTVSNNNLGATNGENLPEINQVLTNTLNTPQTMTYTITPIANNCTGNEEVINVTVNPSPDVQAGNDLLFCITNPITLLSGFSPSGGTWTGSGVDAAGNFDPNIAGIGSHILTYSFTDANGCSNSDTREITVSELPIVDVGDDLTFCTGTEPLTLSGFSPVGGVWSGIGVSTDGIFNPTGLTEGDYILTYTINNGVCEVSDQLTITLGSPVIVDAGADQEVCQNVPLGLSGTPASAVWSVEGTEGSIENNNTFIASVPGTYTLTLTDGSGACKVEDLKTVVVHPSPEPEIEGRAVGVCSLQEIELTAINTNNATVTVFNWSAVNNGGLDNNIFSSESDPTVKLTFPDLQSATPVTYTISLSLTTANGCETTISSDIQLYGRPQAGFDIPLAVCGSSLEPINTTQFANSYNWQITGGNNDATIDDATSESPLISFPPNNTGNTITYMLSLDVTNSNGCIDSYSQSFNVFPQPIMRFNMDKNDGCSPLSINFTNETDPGNGNDISTASFQWLVNGNIEGTTQDFAFTFENNTAENIDYNVTLVSSTIDGCVDSLRKTVTVYPDPIAEMNPLNVKSCAPFVIDKTVINPGIYPEANDEYIWNIYDNERNLLYSESALEFSPYTIINQDDKVIVELITKNVHGCTEAKTEQQFVTIPDPVANFSFPASLGCHPFEVPFTNTSSEGISSFEWFVNGNKISEEENPVYTFINEGNEEILEYTVSLIITAGTGCKDTVTNNIQVKELADFTLDVAEFCPQDPAKQLTFNADRQGEIVWYSSELPNGALTPDGFFDPVIAGGNRNGFKVYADFTENSPEPRCTITDSVLLFVHPFPVPDFETNGFYCSGDLVTFNNLTPDIPGYSINYTWDFGGAGTDTNKNGRFTFNNGTDTVIVKLTAITDKGCTASIEKPVFITEPPVAMFSKEFNPADSCGTLTVKFTDLSNFAWEYEWDFGTGLTSNEPSPITSFAPSLKRDTTYYINLTIRNGCGEDSFRDSIKVKAFPDAKFLFARDTICSEAPLQINNYSKGSPKYYVWDFGDGTEKDTLQHDVNDNQPPIYHEFIYLGDTDTTFIVTLYAINDCGIDSLQKPIVVIPKLVSALFETTGGLRGCAPHTVTVSTINFTSIRLSEANTLIWTFGRPGDEQIGGTKYTITYDQPGDYVIQLTVENDCHRDVHTDTIRVFPNADPKFELFNQDVCLGDSAYIRHTSTNPFASRWNFGNGVTYEGINPPAIYYSDTGTYNISLTETYVGENQTCDQTFTQIVNVLPLPEANFFHSEVDICQSDPQPMVNLSKGAKSYLWKISNEKGVVYNSSIEEQPDLTFNQFGINTITLFAFSKSNQSGCIDSIRSTVNVLPKPSLAPLIEVNREVECGIWTVEFNNPISFPQSILEGDIQIDFGNGQVLSGFEDTYIQKFETPLTGVHEIDITITGITSEGCTDTLVQTLEFTGCCQPIIYLPQENNSFAFTPFNGGVNELFQVKHEFVEQFEMEIYNREGQMVFRTEDLEEGWNGMYKDSKCDTGLYQVVIRYAGCDRGKIIPAKPINIQLFLMD